ncbi:HD domain-containing protein [Filobacillus milosensis]|uniref:bis(5'-nucleosyl)-tetraphosphatase (symmetrical) n=1 Tax=Filobacillus milosensis TaxID=94137 RepID=A0A4Y8IYZ0_9BACI|nr:bis(5'-nucleosyl)-tetraphosphatase (symmetrical) YqeK [Filobacillus milosensis]TFB24871.1 HD domain-containing protein [Filobacillus milosensis]
MKIEEALEESKKVLTQKRYDHVERVTETAINLSEQYHGDHYRVGLAAALHDYAKDMDFSILKQWIVDHVDLPKDLLNYHHEVWHGPVGAKMMERFFMIHDDEVLNAIRYHTTGHKHMSLTEKIVFLADFIEPGRDFPAVHEARKIAEKDLDRACHFALENSIHFLISKKQSIYPDTFFAYNEFTDQLTY